MSEDNVVLLNNGDDDDSTIFQTTQDREKLLKEIQLEDDEDTVIDTTMNVHNSKAAPYWQQVFG
jgi:hypothetical protein